ncbi:hypothetical protein Tco_0097125 [Tanacetum coccineum]
MPREVVKMPGNLEMCLKVRGRKRTKRGYEVPRGVRVARKDDHGVTEGKEDVCEVFQQRGSGAKRKLSRCGRNQMGNEPILAFPERADDFVVYYGSEKPMIEACWKEGEGFFLIMLRIKVNATGELTYRELDFEAKYHLGKANVDVVPWSADLHLGDDRDLGYEEALRQSSIHLGAWKLGIKGLQILISCYNMRDPSRNSGVFDRVGTSGRRGVMGPFWERITTVLMPRVVKSRDEIFSRWGYCDNRGLSRLDNQSIERDRLIGIGFVLDFVEFISFTFGDKEMISVIEAVSR